MERYDVFIRTSFRWTVDRFGMSIKEPHWGKKTYKARGVTIDTARAICEEWNASHDPGPLNRMCEFERS